ncbi:hypothetical protein K490DRAFT_63364 [Saccharata proteae CBS 121410]|uniref:Uncharacterized protein n=1 Tax=Saccharata proteae CBS 121410 TaxID=1314787 RepID=A0A6A5YD17_9PEZI|nr:hypothetical protein K490DRAFT_63364 [Saccharata proteae CBS 121410]
MSHSRASSQTIDEGYKSKSPDGNRKPNALTSKDALRQLVQWTDAVHQNQNLLVDEVVRLREECHGIYEDNHRLYLAQQGLQIVQEQDSRRQERIWMWMKGPGGRHMTFVQRCFDSVAVVAFFVMVYFAGRWVVWLVERMFGDVSGMLGRCFDRLFEWALSWRYHLLQ